MIHIPNSQNLKSLTSWWLPTFLEFETYPILQPNSDNLHVLNGKRVLCSGFEHYGFFADEGS